MNTDQDTVERAWMGFVPFRKKSSCKTKENLGKGYLFCMQLLEIQIIYREKQVFVRVISSRI